MNIYLIALSIASFFCNTPKTFAVPNNFPTNVKTTKLTVSVTEAAVHETYLENPSDLTFPGIIQYNFPATQNLCQLRLDFEDFVIDNPETILRSCNSDVLIINGASNTKYFEQVCGNLTGQHVYLNYGSSSSEITVSIYTASDIGQHWRVKVTGIMCDSVDLAPDGCLQFYTGLTGTVQSFNHNNKLQLNGQDYSVCVKARTGLNKITWRSCSFDGFIISGLPPIPPPNGTDLPPVVNPLSGDDCQTDWVMVFGVNKFCGNALPNVMAITKPWLLQVHFDASELDKDFDDSNTGFCLIYTQSP